MQLRPAVAVASALLGVSALLTGPAHAHSTAAATPSHTPLVIGHRGSPVSAPENTLASVDAAARLGITWVENDVQRTKDGALVVLHDTTLSRTTDVEQRYPDRSPWRVADFTLAEIERLDAGSWYGRRFAGQRVPTLGRYLDRVERNRQNLLMEVKAPELYPGIERRITSELRRRGWLDRPHVARRLVLQSFNAASLRTLHRLRPDLTLGFLGAPKTGELRSYAAYADQLNPNHKSVTPSYLRAVHALRGPHGRALRLSAWTVDDVGTARSLARMGVDGIITNKPAEIRRALNDGARRLPGGAAGSRARVPSAA
ncbi:glycerophosphodiester phosphodiesterase family protein [Streptomyces varsoviensis]|uniref:glycerophosphodiester phosphodiesterase n=1 Tax=Streptomyces varsoviensis TaxID=67373 RepID=UPI0033DBC1C0